MWRPSGYLAAMGTFVSIRKFHATRAVYLPLTCYLVVVALSGANKERIGSSDGAIDAVVAAMRTHVAVAGVQGKACGVLKKLALLGMLHVVALT